MKEHWNSKTEGISMTLGGMLAILFYVVLYNRMMAYVESRAYRAAPATLHRPEYFGEQYFKRRGFSCILTKQKF